MPKLNSQTHLLHHQSLPGRILFSSWLMIKIFTSNRWTICHWHKNISLIKELSIKDITVPLLFAVHLELVFGLGKLVGPFFKPLYCCTDSRLAHNTNVTDVFPPFGLFQTSLSKYAFAHLSQAATQNSCHRAWTITISQYGYKELATTRTTPGSFSMLIRSSITINRLFEAGQARSVICDCINNTCSDTL